MANYREIITISYFASGSGYDHESIESNEIVDTTDNLECIIEWLEDYLSSYKGNNDVWFVVDTDYYEEDSDPMFDTPVKSVRFTCFWKPDSDDYKFVIKDI